MMNKILYRFKKPFLSMKGIEKIKREIAETQMGHSKIIGWENGLPVRSLMFPSENSDVSGHAMVRFYNSLRAHNTLPFMSNFALTNNCNFKCKHCSAAGQKGEELSTEEWKDIIRQSIELGVFIMMFTGGEPLLRKDLCEIIGSVDKKKTVPIIFTNGFLLKNKIKELKKSGLNRVYVSIDYADPKLHDGHRQMIGAYKKAIESIRAAKTEGMLVGISTFASQSRIEDGTLEKIFKLGDSLDVNEIFITNEMPIGRNTKNYKLGTVGKDYPSMIKKFVKINQRKFKKMGIFAYQQITSVEATGCSAGTNMFKVAFNGDLWPCEFCNHTVGNLKKDSLYLLWPKMRELAAKKRNEQMGCWVLNDYKKKLENKNSND
jgi:MoaA/NifB/PqqE/SkfB family radical SAM enzyme